VLKPKKIMVRGSKSVGKKIVLSMEIKKHAILQNIGEFYSMC
jgi:hypothetical protein